jgi:membrane protein
VRSLRYVRLLLVLWWKTLPEMTRALPGYLVTALFGFLRHGTRQAAALAYYAVFSIFPLTLLLAVGISRLLGPVVAQQQIQIGLSAFLPPSVAPALDLIQTNVTQAIAESQSFGLIALLGLAWSASGLFTNITNALDTIFNVPALRSIWRQRLMAVLMTFMLIALIAASFITSGVLRLLSALLLDRPNPWLNAGVVFLPLTLNIVIFLLLFRYVPARPVRSDAAWPAAIIGALGWEAAKSGFGWFLANVANFQFVYGSIAAVIVLLFWAYLIAAIFLFSAELCAKLNEWMERHDEVTSDELKVMSNQ